MASANATARRSPAARRKIESAHPAKREAEKPQLRVVEEGERKPHAFATYFWIGVAAFGIALVVMVVSQVMLTQATFRTAEARRELVEARAENERLRLEKAEAESPTLLEDRAKRQLEMVTEEKAERLSIGPVEPNPVPLPPAPPEPSSPSPAPVPSPQQGGG